MAYEFKSLLDAFAKRGLNLTEDAAKGVVEDVTSWFEVQAKASATPFDDVALVVLPQLKKVVLDKIDELDGEVG